MKTFLVCVVAALIVIMYSTNPIIAQSSQGNLDFPEELTQGRIWLQF